MRYAVIVWKQGETPEGSHGTVHGWYEFLATAIRTATELRQQAGIYHACVTKLV